LEEEKLVRHIPNRGVSLMEMTLPMALDLYQVRGVLEGQAARLAAGIMDTKTLARLEAIQRTQAVIVEKGDLLRYSDLDFQFHGIIYESCGNWLLQELLDNIKSRSRPLVVNLAPILPRLYEDHIHAVEAFKKKDGSAAEKIMKNHNMRMYHHIEKTYKRSPQ
ncbi:MAG TPA: GntR family transcriptional regulator, partial [Thermodesulfobacteriota bacterium]|nr:GntR family transcriptional regulator [Thermodesulfobacteriota bacterium]